MENIDIFVRTLLTDKVKLKPKFVNAKVKDHLLESLRSKFEGVCSYHGYIRPGSIEIFKFSMGYIQALSLNGDVEYMVNYYADVCNPSIGSVVHTKVVNANKFGILAHTGIRDGDDKFIPILEIVVSKNMITAQNDKNPEEISIGDDLHVEILGKKFELTDKKICAFGRIIDTDQDQNILDDTHESESHGDINDPEIDDDEEEDADEDEGSDDQEAEEEVDEEDEDDDEEEDDASLIDGGDADADSLDSEGFFSGESDYDE